jgi:hypothetical protein
MIYQLTDFGTYLGEAANNVYFYQNIDPGTALSALEMEDMVQVFSDVVLAPIRAFQNEGFSHDRVEIRNLSNGVDFVDVPVSLVGTEITGADSRMASFVTISFQLVRSTLTTKSGRKSYSGINEPRVSGNTYTFSSASVEGNAEAALAATLSLDSGREMTPVIVKRPLPNPGGVFIVNPIASAVFKGLGTQNSRKRGRGD